MGRELVNKDVLGWASTYAGPRFHALMCDPPYELGFMGKGWDSSGISFSADTWAALATHLHPGAFLVAFASARGWHRLAAAIEDAGLVIHPSIFGWATGQGMPKATRVRSSLPAWEGHRYGLQVLKPALEPIIVAQKPYRGRPTDCITTTGAGTLNVAATKVPGAEGEQPRWPANLVLVDNCAACRLDQQTATTEGTSVVGASRFFLRVGDQVAASDPVFYAPKASVSEREAGLSASRLPTSDQVVYRRRRRHAAHNVHPCVKPIELTTWLAKLLLPPVEFAPRRLLVPFSGSGSEVIGAELAGWDVVVGVERERAYVNISRARAAHWAKREQRRREVGHAG